MASGVCSRHTRWQVSDLLLPAVVHSDSLVAEPLVQSPLLFTPTS